MIDETSPAAAVRAELAVVRELTYTEKLISVCLLDVIEGLTGGQANRGAVAVMALLKATGNKP